MFSSPYVFQTTVSLQPRVLAMVSGCLRFESTSCTSPDTPAYTESVSAAIVTWLLWGKAHSWMGPEDKHPMQVASGARACSLLCCVPAAPAVSPAAHDIESGDARPLQTRRLSTQMRAWQGELARIAAITPWKGYLGGVALVVLNVMGMGVLLNTCVAALHTAGVL